MKTDFKNYAFIFVSGSLWGTIGLFVKLMDGFGSTSSYTSFLRLFIVFFLLVIITLVKDGAAGFRVSRRTLISCLLLGVVCQGIYNIFYSMSVSQNGMAMASVLLYTSPVFTSITAMLAFRERLTKRKWLALFINIIGCILTATGGNLSGSTIALGGFIIGLGAGFTYAMSAIFGRLATDDQASPFAIATYNFLFGSAFVALTTHPWTTVSSPLDCRLLIVGTLFALIPTALGYIFYFKGLSRITQSSKVPVVASVELVVATILGVLLFSEQIGAFNIVGIVCVLCSILLFS